jgi:hypothetical protein
LWAATRRAIAETGVPDADVVMINIGRTLTTAKINRR